MLSFFHIPSDSLLLDGSYNQGMVFLSVLIAVISAIVALTTLGFQRDNFTKMQNQLAIIAASISLGVGIWSMHFIGMLAFQLCTPITYSASITFASIIPSFLASWIALNLMSSTHIELPRLLLGSGLIALGIGTMHYTGMAAMSMAAQLRYDPTFFVLSLVVAFFLAFIALYAHTKLFYLSKLTLKIFAGTILGLAISGMHYTGMAASRFVAPADFVSVENASNSSMLTAAVIFTTIAVSLLVVLFQLILKFRQASLRASSYAVRLSNMMNTALDAIITFDDKGKIVICNPAATKLLGWSGTELLQKNFADILPRGYAERFYASLIEHQKTGVSKVSGSTLQIEVLTKEQQKIAARLAINHVYIDKKTFYNAFLYDISEQLSMQNSLKKNEQQLRSLIANIPGAAYRSLIDKDWSMVFISDAVEQLSGYPAADFIIPNAQRTWADLIHPEDLPFISAIDYTSAFTAEYRIINRQGEIRWMFEHGDVVHDDDNQIYALDGFIMDITERREMEERLRDAKIDAEQSAEVKSAFLANMSHEIRTPLNAVIGFTDLLLENPDSPDAVRYIQTVNQSAKSLLVLLNDILDSAKLEKGKLELELVNFNLTELVDNVISTLWVNARNKQLALNFSLSPQLANFYVGAAPRIRQVLLNILGNAIKFTEQGSVNLDVKPNADNIVFEITDTGIGIAEDRLAQIFEPFTQADASMSRRFGGTGLGTTISKKLVELMGGSISATSALGKGSTFTVMLPLKVGETVVSEVKLHKLPPMHFLIADDIPQNLELLSAILQRDKHQVTTASNGAEVIEVLKQIEPDVVLLDVQMPVMDGLTAATLRREYEALQKLPRVPIVALTASALAEDRQAVLNAGMDGFASKPIDTDALFSEIARVLNIDLISKNDIQTPDESSIIAFEKGEHLWGSKAQYHAELQRFANGPLQHLCEDILTAENAKDTQAMQRVAHSFKGLTGNLCLPALADSCAKLEHALRSAAEPLQSELLSDLIKQLCHKAELTRKSINNLHSTSSPRVSDQILQETSVLPALLNKLAAQLNAFNYEDALIRQLRQLSEAGCYSDSLIKIIDTTEAFNFEQAQDLITSLLTELEP